MIPAPTPKARLALLLSVTLGLPVAALAQDDTPARSPADTALLSTIVGMDFGKQSAVYDRLGFDPGPEFWNGVCRAAAYGSSSASQVFHPDTIGTYDDRYSCNHPGISSRRGLGLRLHALPAALGPGTVGGAAPPRPRRRAGPTRWIRWWRRPSRAAVLAPLPLPLPTAARSPARRNAPCAAPRRCRSPAPAGTGCSAMFPRKRTSTRSRRRWRN